MLRVLLSPRVLLAQLVLWLLVGCSPSGVNVLVILLDDARIDSLSEMPTLQNRLKPMSVEFTNAFTPDPLCCPDRASKLTGLRIVNHQVLTLTGPFGGAHRMREFGADLNSMGVLFQERGFHTAYIGKYLNSYNLETEGVGDGLMYVPPGWTEWKAVMSPEFYGGALGDDYTFVLEDGSQVTTLGGRGGQVHMDDSGYRTDVERDLVIQAMENAAEDDRRFMIYWSPTAPHVGYDLLPKPALRHDGQLSAMALHRPPHWNEADVGDKPLHVQSAPNDSITISLTDAMREKHYESLMAVDEALEDILDYLESQANMVPGPTGALTQLLKRTVIVVTSDNGVTWGEHRLFAQGKTCPYEECQRVPLILKLATGQPRSVPEIALSYDLLPTLLDVAEIPKPANVTFDGKSLLRLARGKQLPVSWRTDYLMEFIPWSAAVGIPAYNGVYDVTNGLKYVLHDTGEEELYDLSVDPYELESRHSDPGYAGTKAQLSARLTELVAQ